jgi:ATP-dependent DNA helicase PIF1
LTEGAVLLKQIVRQASDPTLADILGEVRLGELSKKALALLRKCHTQVKPPPEDDGIVPTKLYCYNRAVDKENNARLDMLEGSEVKLKALDTWNESLGSDMKTQLKDTMDKRVPKLLRLKVDAQVILIKNKPEWNLFNGSRGIVVGFHNDDPLVRFDTGRTQRISRESFSLKDSSGNEFERSQVPLKLGWALTVHKAAGLTLSRAELQMDGAFEAGQTYVALSRVTDTAGLWISGRGISAKGTRADADALKFYAEIEGDASR